MKVAEAPELFVAQNADKRFLASIMVQRLDRGCRALLFQQLLLSTTHRISRPPPSAAAVARAGIRCPSACPWPGLGRKRADQAIQLNSSMRWAPTQVPASGAPPLSSRGAHAHAQRQSTQVHRGRKRQNENSPASIKDFPELPILVFVTKQDRPSLYSYHRIFKSTRVVTEPVSGEALGRYCRGRLSYTPMPFQNSPDARIC